jgi:hypothetical protein
VPPVLALDEVACGRDEVVVAGFHPLLRQRSGVLDPLLADPAPALVLLRVVLVRRLGAQNAPRPEPLAEVREVFRRWVVRRLRILLGVQVVEVAEELVEPVHRREEFVPVAEVVLAELPGRVAEGLQLLGDRRILRLQP